MEVDLEETDEEYVIQRAKKALKDDPLSAKTWIITAKSLYPNNFTVQYEAYLIEKNAGNLKEAARCLSDLIRRFQEHTELWKEIEKIIRALRAETGVEDAEMQFLCEMFKHISSEVQHELLLITADHCVDPMEHCKLLLLLLQRFPTAIPSHGPELIDRLMSAEKHNTDEHYPMNNYRKLLICELLPLLAKQETHLDLNSKLLLKLLNKALEYYLCGLGQTRARSPDNDSSTENTWSKLFFVLEFIGKQLNWDPQLTNFTGNWSREAYWQKILSYFQLKSKHNMQFDDKQLLFCLSIFFIHCLHEYNISLVPEHAPGQTVTPYLLVEAFSDPSLPSPISEPKNKKRKSETEMAHATLPYISVEKPEIKSMQGNFLMCVSCWDLLSSSESMKRDFMMIHSYLRVDTWLSLFLIDYWVYKAKYDESLIYLQSLTDPNIVLQKYIRLANILYLRGTYNACLEPIQLCLPLLPTNNPGNVSNNLIIGGNQRHLHYLPLTKLAILQYLVKVLLRSIVGRKAQHIGRYCELSIGHILVLVQLDWPQEEDFVPPLLEEIKEQRSFTYPLFQSYITNVEIMEEITFLWSNQGGQIHLEIFPSIGNSRRMGTRGADKGAKEELKQAIKRQVSRCNEKIDDLIIKFIQDERSLIVQALV